MSDIESFQIVMARKPLQGTVADNVTTWGVGAINIDGCRVGDASGRWPANVILDEDAGEALDAQSGERISGGQGRRKEAEGMFGLGGDNKMNIWYSDSGGASRFFFNTDTAEPIIERTNMHYQLLHGDNREQLKHLADNSIDSIVCDPPYELGFMGKRWDSTGIAYDLTVWAECLRVLKPGGHLIAFGGTRTYHRMTVAIEDAGFEIRDCIMYLYGSGFPKSLDVSKALDKQAGAEREVVGPNKFSHLNGKENLTCYGAASRPNETAPATDLAKQWHGYGTALKPAVEPAVLARKPLIGTVADNVTTWGTGAINIDGCRVGDASGRWPANVILDEDAGEALDAQSGERKSAGLYRNIKTVETQSIVYQENMPWTYKNTYANETGGASRFFYTAKASKAEREAGLEGMEVKPAGGMQGRQDGSLEGEPVHRANHHPTVKPIALMRYLVRLVTPKGGTVLDPFMGSGSTGCAAMCEGVDFVGIELSEEYLEIARRRIEYWQSQNPMGL